MINIKEYLMTRGNEERRVYHIVKNGRIDLLQQIFPDAETLVAKTENCREFGYDVMANLADDGNTGMLKKILSAYFSENTEENNALKRRFLLSHRINGTPKDFHHFIRFLSPREQKQAKFEQMECSDIDEIVFQQQKLKRGVFPPDLRSKKDRRRAEFYYLLRDEYQNSLPLKNPHEKMPTARLGIAPKGVSAVEIKGYVGSPEEKNAAEFRSWQETYPRFRLTKIPEDQQPDQPLCCRTEDLPAIPYRPGRYDLAKEAFRQMHFPTCGLTIIIFISCISSTVPIRICTTTTRSFRLLSKTSTKTDIFSPLRTGSIPPLRGIPLPASNTAHILPTTTSACSRRPRPCL